MVERVVEELESDEERHPTTARLLYADRHPSAYSCVVRQEIVVPDRRPDQSPSSNRIRTESGQIEVGSHLSTL